MVERDFQRARSVDAKQRREAAILEAARDLATRDRVRTVTITQIAEAVDLHKSAILRYFETREEVFLRLGAEEWASWSLALRDDLTALAPGDVPGVAREVARSLAERPLFCDLLAQAPMNLERNVSPEAVRRYKYVTRDGLDTIVAALTRVLPDLGHEGGVDVVASATALAGVFWQVGTPEPQIRELYRSDPELGHALVELQPRLERVLRALLAGLVDCG